MKKIFALIMSVFMAAICLVGCDKQGECSCHDSCGSSCDVVGGGDSGNTNDKGESTMNMGVHYDYGLHVENELTMLLDGCNFFFKPADYGISKLIAGDIVTITYKGECYIQETYPGRVVTKDMTIIDITVQEAPIFELSIMHVSDGYYVFHGNNGVACNTSYVINEDGTFEELSEKHVGEKLYGTIPALTSSMNIIALYSYNPRPNQPTIGHTCALVCLEDVEPTCQTEGKTVIGCTFCGAVYEETVLEKVDCQLNESGKCIWCEPTLADLYTWIKDLTVEDITSMKRDCVIYGVVPGFRVDSRTTTEMNTDKEMILSYLKCLSLKAVSEEEGAVDGGGGVHLTIYTAEEVYTVRENNGYFLINGIYYKLSERLPEFDEETAVWWEPCCFCGSYDCTGHEE